MSEASETRKAPETRTLKIHCEKPPPLVAQRPAMPSEIPRAALSFIRAALAARWHAQAFYALGWRVDGHGSLTGQLRASVSVRLRRGGERALAVWGTPWPIPPGFEPPGLDTPPELPPHIPRFPGMAARVAALRAQRVAQLKTSPEVKWVYELGTYWVSPASPLGPREGGGTGWWPATELKQAVSSPPR